MHTDQCLLFKHTHAQASLSNTVPFHVLAGLAAQRSTCKRIIGKLNKKNWHEPLSTIRQQVDSAGQALFVEGARASERGRGTLKATNSLRGLPVLTVSYPLRVLDNIRHLPAWKKYVLQEMNVNQTKPQASIHGRRMFQTKDTSLYYRNIMKCSGVVLSPNIIICHLVPSSLTLNITRHSRDDASTGKYPFLLQSFCVLCRGALSSCAL